LKDMFSTGSCYTIRKAYIRYQAEPTDLNPNI
jgi:hypothetical protein